ncbi:malonate--CoA ligase ACSF3, mitochondrial [Calliphora vicina]|uniref:malonate--CoA ligase ACSF3, mitochondrial n=1 Tax=Calliphora vicina TaxID=7373 RepID=UPI00325BA16E
MQLILFGHRTLRRLFCDKVNIDKLLKVTTSLSHLQEYKEYTHGVNKIVPLFKIGLLYADNICLKDFAGQYTYLQLYNNSKILSRQISNICGSGSSSTIAFFSSNDVLTVLILWSIWMSGQTAMALKRDQTYPALDNLVKRNKTRLLISSDKYENCSRNLAFENSIALLKIDHKFLNMDQANNDLKPEIVMATQKNTFLEGVLFNEFYNSSGALYICTNENDEIPKIILLSHKELNTHIRKTVQTWNICETDRILSISPLFHRYNDEYIYNMLFPLSVGSHVFLFEPFDAKSAWRTILGINIPLKERVNILIAEPKVYQLLIQEYDKMFVGDNRMMEYIKDYCLRNIRLMIYCFLPLNPSIFSAWLKITGHSLLETDFRIDYLNSKPCGGDIHDNKDIRLRIVDANKNVLLELDDIQMERLQTSHRVVVGRLMITFNHETFCSTGEIVSYCNGVLKKIGRYHCSN